MANLCLSRTATSLWVSSWKSLSLMMTGVSWLLLRKTYFKPEGRVLAQLRVVMAPPFDLVQQVPPALPLLE